MDLRRTLRLKAHFWLERRNWHLVRSGVDDPVPDSRSLGDIESRVSALPGVDMRESAQLELLSRFEERRPELVELGVPPSFGAVDVEVLYCIVREHEPRLFIEVKSGASTRTAALAMTANEKQGSAGGTGTIIVIDPGAAADLEGDPRISVRREQVTLVDADFFQQLGPDDICFIDTSHVLKTGSDVQHIFLEVLPRVPVGSLVHVHDIFVPREYPLEWFTGYLRSPNEQYVLQAFLAFNDSFEVVWSSAYMHHHHPERLSRAFHSYDPNAPRQGASFWMRRVK
jgi:hypothetical protein